MKTCKSCKYFKAKKHYDNQFDCDDEPIMHGKCIEGESEKKAMGVTTYTYSDEVACMNGYQPDL